MPKSICRLLSFNAFRENKILAKRKIPDLQYATAKCEIHVLFK